MSTKFKLLIAVSIILIIGLIVATVISRNAEPGDKGSTLDTNSGEYVANSDGREPENVGANPDEPLFLGLGKLVNRGLTTEQISGLKLGFTNFAKQSSPKVKRVSITVDSIRNAPRSIGDFTYTYHFDVVMDSKTTYQAKLICFDTTSIQLILYKDGTSSPAFDSGTITPYDGVSTN